LFQTSPYASATLIDRLRDGWRRRAFGTMLALGIEAVLVLAVLSLGIVDQVKKPRSANLVSVAIPGPKADKASPAKSRPTDRDQAAQHALQPQNVPSPVQPTIQPPQPQSPAFIPLARSQLAMLDISRLPRQAAAPAGKALMGPADLGVPGDSKRVGTAPGGQPLYAASWYREPYDDELRGYLSTAQGPGWGLIACRTAPNYRVEDCVALDEYPGGSNIARAVVAAAWQFKVRPPRVGGVSQVGDWVRIRIDYTERRN